MKRLLTLCALVVLVLLAVTWAFGCREEPAVEHNNRGIELAEAGQYKRAIAEFTKAIELRPNWG